jgi:hypothetical protein
MKNSYTLGEEWTNKFNYEKMLDTALTVTTSSLDDLKLLKQTLDSIEYVSESIALNETILSIESGNNDAQSKLDTFYSLIQTEKNWWTPYGWSLGPGKWGR